MNNDEHSDHPREIADKALEAYGEACFRAGFNSGLDVARQITTWLGRQPDRKWQAQVRGWAKNAIKHAEEDLPKTVHKTLRERRRNSR